MQIITPKIFAFILISVLYLLTRSFLCQVFEEEHISEKFGDVCI